MKGIVRREVTRVLTPGTALDATLGAGDSQWLASVAAVGSGAGACVGVALMDLSTGEFRATEFSGAMPGLSRSMSLPGCIRRS